MRARGDARPAGQVPRRPHRVVPDRHPLARPPRHRGGRGQARRDHPRHAPRRPRAASAPSRCIRARASSRAARSLRTTPGPLSLPRLRGARPRGLPEQDADVASTAPSATRWPRSSWRPWSTAWRASSALDPVEVRRRNLLTADMYPYTAPTGLFFEKLSHEESLDAVLELSGYRALCAERDRLRARGVYRGLGLCVFIDLTVPGAQTYGTGGARISSQDGTHDPARADAASSPCIAERDRAGAGDRHHPRPGGGGDGGRGRSRTCGWSPATPW